ncbi:50S ribosomal protein L7ae [Anoxybacter fermentans]|uniref:50S ribosomal protein L7ae n=2 Tax=Anoxybacter fermentans TaxID=1323375 RepID=A0A3Q9HT51_9FIRM|nr:50S ribosomal protein L7ae [Anoxybacter fermentans]
MMLTRLKESDNRVVGSKQTLKALKGERVEHLFIAKDAETRITDPLVELAKKSNVPIHYVDTMAELGEAAGIEVGAAAAAILKDQ